MRHHWVNFELAVRPVFGRARMASHHHAEPTCSKSHRERSRDARGQCDLRFGRHPAKCAAKLARPNPSKPKWPTPGTRPTTYALPGEAIVPIVIDDLCA